MYESLSWKIVAMETVKILGPAFIAVVGTIMAGYHQLKAKDKELSATAKLKARELVYQTLQKRLENIEASRGEFNSAIGKLLGTLAAASDDPSLKAETESGMRRFLLFYRTELIDDLSSSEGSFAEERFADLRSRCAQAREYFESFDFSGASIEDVMKEMWRAYDVLKDCETKFLEMKSGELFGQWLV